MCQLLILFQDLQLISTDCFLGCHEFFLSSCRFWNFFVWSIWIILKAYISWFVPWFFGFHAWKTLFRICPYCSIFEWKSCYIKDGVNFSNRRVLSPILSAPRYMIYVSIQLACYRSFVGGVFQKWGHVLFSLSLAFSPPRFHGLDLSDAFDEKALFMSCFLHLFFILYIYTQILKQEKTRNALLVVFRIFKCLRIVLSVWFYRRRLVNPPGF